MRLPSYSLSVVVASALFLTGCGYSAHPLSDPLKSKADARLAGVWRMRGDKGVMYCHIGVVGEKLPPSVMRAVAIMHEEGKMKGPVEYLLFPTVLGTKTYLNLTGGEEQQINLLQQKGWTDETANSYFFLKYQLEGDKLTVWNINDDAKRQAIESGKVKGEIDPKNKSSRFTDTTENLARFVAEAGDGLFSKTPWLRLERVEGAAKP